MADAPPAGTYAGSIALAGAPTQDQIAEAIRCRARFWRFLVHWRFINRETGEVASFARVWRGQADMAAAMERYPRLYILKAGKLGATELACAFDAWRLRFGQPNARVHLFSLDQDASTELLRIVRFGLERLPEWMRLPVVDGEAGADTSRSLMLLAGPDDVRVVKSWPVKENVSIDQSCQHAHVDEWARMRWAMQVINAVQSTVAPGGSMHIVTRGAGPNEQGKMFREAMLGRNEYHALFVPWTARPRPEGWREREAPNYTAQGIAQFAPTTWQEALQGDETYVYPQFENPPGRHVKTAPPCPLKACEKVGIGVDPGAVNPTAMLLAGERSSGGVHVYEEFYRPGVGADEVGAQCAAWWREHELDEYVRRARDWVYVAVPDDEKLLAATLNSFFQRARLGMRAVPAIREIRSGITLVTQRLNVNALTVGQHCVHTIEEFADYRNTTVRDAVTRVEYAGERPIRHHADAMDALRYVVNLLATWARPEVQTTATGRRIVGRRR
jgi:hypothetical protein